MIVNTSRTAPGLAVFLISILALAVCSAVCSGADQGAGYVFYKEQGFHPDSKAIVKEVISYESFPTIARAKTKTGQRLEITSGQSPVFLPDPNGSTSPADEERLIKQLVIRYPQHHVLLEKLLAVCSNRPKAPAAAPAATPESGVESAQNKPDFYVVLADGSKIEHIKIGALTEDHIRLIIDGGFQNISYDSIQLSLSKLDPEAIAEIEKGRALQAEKKKQAAEEERKHPKSSLYAFSPRGPSIKGFQIGMSMNEFVENLRKIYPSAQIRKEKGYNIFGNSLSNVTNDAHVDIVVFLSSLSNYEELAVVATFSTPQQVIAIEMRPPLVAKLFKASDMSFEDFCQSFINGYSVPTLKTTTTRRDDGTIYDAYYGGPDGWSIELRQVGYRTITLQAIPLEKERGFGE